MHQTLNILLYIHETTKTSFKMYFFIFYVSLLKFKNKCYSYTKPNILNEIKK